MTKWVVVTGATGRVGAELSRALLGRGARVRAIGRSAERLQGLVAKGAEARVGSVTDTNFLASAFEGASAVFAMIPPNYAAPDVRAYQRQVGESLASALQKARVPRVVSLSSVGADQANGTGPIAGLHWLEQRLARVPGLHALHLRPTFFMENLLGSIGLIKSAGVNGSLFRGDLPVPMIATRDIAAQAAVVLAEPTFDGTSTRELLGPREYTHREATAILGAAVGKPDLAYVEFPEGEIRKAMLGMGLSASMVGDFVEMQQAFNAGRVRSFEGRTPASTTPTTLEEFARTVFAPAYQAS